MTGALATWAVGSPAAEYEVVFSDVGGVERRQSLTSCWEVAFERAAAARQFTSYRGGNAASRVCVWYFAPSGEHVGYVMWLERDQLMALDADPDGVAVSSQPFWLHWTDPGGRAVRHAPDFFDRLQDGTAVVVDVRADGRIEPDDAQKFSATASACRSVGWAYRRVGALDPVLATNLRWLSSYRHPRCHQRERAAALRRALAGPAPLMDGAVAVGDPLGVLPVLLHLLWRHELEADLCAAPLGPRSLLRVVQIDSTPLNVRVVLDNSVVDRVKLTWVIDLATRTIPAAVLRPSTKAADAAVLLARALTPEPMRPGWTDALRMSRSVRPGSPTPTAYPWSI